MNTSLSIKEEFIETADRRTLFLRSWLPQRHARAALAVVHGFNSHSGHYGEVAAFLASHGIAVYAIDLRGRGRSPGARFYVERFEDYVEDVRTLIDLVHLREPARQPFLLGHSAGGVIACVYASAHQEQLAGLICESFAFEIPAPALALRLIKALGSIAPRFPVLTLPHAAFSRDTEVIARMANDALIAGEREPARTVGEMVRANALLSRSFAEIRLPLLILHGSADTVTRPAGSVTFHRAAASADKTLRVFEGYYHDLLNDRDREEVFDEVLRWMEARLPRTWSGLLDLARELKPDP